MARPYRLSRLALLATLPLLAGCGTIDSVIGGPDDAGPGVPRAVVEAAPEGNSILARTAPEPLLIESVAFDERGRLLVASIHQAGVFRMSLDGALTRLTAEGATRGVFGMVSDRARGDLWITTTNTLYDSIPGEGGTALMKLDLATGAVRGVYAMPEPNHRFTDLALGPDGSVFVSDEPGRAILQLAPGASALQAVATLPEGASPQGIVVSEDGRWLIYADYGTGLHRVVIDTGASQPVRAASGVELRGLDGLALRGNRIVAVQNGTQTPRVLGLTLSADWTQVTDRAALFEGDPLSEPTTGFISGDNFVFVARSQWTDFAETGAPETQTPVGAAIGRIGL